jgi:predicted GIY-YIG superfamily endonuclease
MRDINIGLVKKTKNRTPFDLVYNESYNTRREAMLRERYLKSIGGVKEKKTIIERLSQPAAPLRANGS